MASVGCKQDLTETLDSCKDKVDFHYVGESLPKDALSEAVLDELYSQGVSNELIKNWTRRETKVWLELGTCEQRPPQLQSVCRQATLRFMEGLARLTGLSLTGWHAAALLWDIACQSGLFAARTSDIEAIADVPAAAAALVLLLRKDECSETAPRVAEVSPCTSQFASWLQRTVPPEKQSPRRTAESPPAEGPSCENKNIVTADNIVSQQRNVLQALSWQMNLPSTMSWIQALCARLDIISGKEFTSSLGWVFTQSLTSSHALLMHSPSSSEMMPRQIANGLLCLFLIVARVLPLSSMWPIFEVTRAEWECLFLETKLATKGLPSCELPSDRLPHFLRSLLQATDCSAEALQVDALAVAKAMRRVVSGLPCSAETDKTLALQVQQNRQTEQLEQQRKYDEAEKRRADATERQERQCQEQRKAAVYVEL